MAVPPVLPLTEGVLTPTGSCLDQCSDGVRSQRSGRKTGHERRWRSACSFRAGRRQEQGSSVWVTDSNLSRRCPPTAVNSRRHRAMSCRRPCGRCPALCATGDREIQPAHDLACDGVLLERRVAGCPSAHHTARDRAGPVTVAEGDRWAALPECEVEPDRLGAGCEAVLVSKDGAQIGQFGAASAPVERLITVRRFT